MKVSTRITSDSLSPRRHRTTQPQFLAATKQFANSPLDPYGFGALESDLPTLTSSSTSMSGDNGDSNPTTTNGDNYDIHDDHDAPFADHRHHIDDASTDDPYTYSDDSASLSDAYFLQQASPDNLNVGYFGLLSLSPPDADYGDSHSEDEEIWAGPPLLHLNEKSNPLTGSRRRDDPNSRGTSARDSRRFSDRDQRRNQRQRQQERYASSSAYTVDKDEPINESTSLLDGKSAIKIRQRDREYVKNQKFPRAKNTNASMVVKSNAHRQHREKHQLRKHKRNVMVQEQQKRQEERERAVTEVRGQPQPPTSKKHRFWLFLFLLQLFLVCSFAIKYGLTFYRPPTISDSTSDEINPTVVSSMLTNGVGNENPRIQSAVVDDDHPLSTPKLTDGTEHDLDGSYFATNPQDEPFTIDYKNVLSLLVISGMHASITSYLSFAFMLILARSIIPIMLVFTILIMLCWGVFGLTVDTNAGNIISLVGFTVFGLSFAYTMSNWNQIPLCSTNFHTAICAMRSSFGIMLVGISSLFVVLFWLLIWMIALMGTLNRHNSTDCEMWDECEIHVYIFRGRIIEFGLLLVSLYWTTTVIKNVVQVAVAGFIGGPWWFAMEYEDAESEIERGQPQTIDRGCGCRYKSRVADPLARACTNSLGTICFGSLVELPAQLLSKIVSCLCWLTGSRGDDSKLGSASEQNNQNATTTSIQKSDNGDDEDEENAGIADIVEGMDTTDSTLQSQKQAPATAEMTYFGSLKQRLRCLDRGLQSCNRWSYIYIGMYNYSYCEGGEKALQLFETREWMDIARDTLIQNILLMASIVIGGSCGIVAVLVEEVDGYEFTSLHKPILTSFLIGFFLGFILSNILLLGLAASAVNTVLVCFAAEPFAFDRNHPHLSREMREVWSQQVWEPDASGG
jgi:hypothetical protein